MKTEEIKALWGEELFNAFADHIDEEGFITCDWAQILEENFSDYDKNYNDTHEKSSLYQRMYLLDTEESLDGLRIRPIR